MDEVKAVNQSSRLIKGMRALAVHAQVHYNTIYLWNKSGLLKIKKRVKKTMYFDPDDFIVEKSMVRHRK